MAHLQQIEFCQSVKAKFPEYFSKNIVIDIGSLDINGNNQYLFKDCLYIGVDINPGKNVDIVSKGHELNLPDESVDVVISTECFEHDQFYMETLRNIYRILKPGGLFLFTCATTGRPEHGTRRASPQDAPFLTNFGDWGDYYKNLDESDIRSVLDVEKLFSKFEFTINQDTHDLYFWGIKHGLRVPRHDYSFLLRAAERDRQFASLNQAIAERDVQIASLKKAVAESNEQITSLNQAIAERDVQIDSLKKAVAESNEQITSLNQTIAERDGQITAILSSRSWRLTEPLRVAGRLVRGLLRFASAAFRVRLFSGERFSVVSTNNHMPKANRWLLLARYVYLRLPFSEPLKWKIRERVAPILNALVRGGVRELSPAKVNESLWGHDQPTAHSTNEHALACLIQDIATYCSSIGKVSHIITLPFLGTGGAERVAINFARAIRQLKPYRSVLIVIADRPIQSHRVDIPEGTIVVRLGDYLPAKANESQKRLLLRSLIEAVRPDTLHNINSEVAWKMIIEDGARLQRITNIFGSIFAFQFLPDGITKIGYAKNFLMPALPYLTALLSDNQRFLVDAIQEYRLDEANRQKMMVVYNPCGILDEATISRSSVFIGTFAVRSPQRRLRVLWAGRLDAEKRVDLLIDIIRQCSFADFFVFGQSVVDQEEALPNLPNLIYRGPFSDPRELVTDIDFDAFIFTSRWEGMPNIILEVGALGIPVVAPTVGGVGELICEKTGYPLPERPDVAHYEAALRQIAVNPESAARRSVELLNCIKSRHSWNTFIKRVKEIPLYFREEVRK